MIHFDPHAAKIVTEFVLARIISAAIGPVSDSLPMLLTYLKIEVISSGSSVQELRFCNSMSTGSHGTGSRSPWSMQEGTRTLRDD